MPSVSELKRTEEERKIFKKEIAKCVKNHIQHLCTYKEIKDHLVKTLQYDPDDEFALCRVLRPALQDLVASKKLLIGTNEKTQEFALFYLGK